MASQQKNPVLSPYRCFDPEPSQREVALQLYSQVRDLPLICPHGHVDPRLLADPEARFGSPAELFVIPDHYILRMLYSQGVPMESLGVPTKDGTAVETDHRKIWQRFADHFYLFRGTPTGLWVQDELQSIFGIHQKLGQENAGAIYDRLVEQLSLPEYSPRALFRRFNIEVLCTTDAATDPLNLHRTIQQDGFPVRPTFRPDAVVNLDTEGWTWNIQRLSDASGIEVVDERTFLEALRQRRQHFKTLGATATDHAAPTAHTGRLGENERGSIFNRALRGQASAEDARRFTGHMLIEFAHMSAEDGLVMQLHIGSERNHNPQVFQRFGRDMGADLPRATEWTRNLRPLLDEVGNDSRLSVVLFTLDESTYSRELAPLAGHYPVLRLGPPWWFFDSVKGMECYLDQVVETAGIHNLAGFNDDTRAFASIPVRHDVWRRVSCNWLAAQVVRGLIDFEDAREMAAQLAYGLAKTTYRFTGGEA
ncbi:glucuronate isomerase [Deinococcus cellulosilyticus]|uniref:Uronate isomerase n=1 Tax=Deinococcus cellulosilyticus (strain DSM 18568 / NBRC 106333 / KACC 11606 / 5516J-15) TaxID=1223518 RepID=A0A511N0F3_DEIC1|nr:glucuronate isomerase [Deinococcus cellulosilyticus]GEM46323.1 uronate isomerase [Deinococcus cellulosilyticus NBRC 106333 = KACC 11606]